MRPPDWWATFKDDLANARTRGVLRPTPQKGLRKAVLVLAHAAAHLLVLLLLALYGAFTHATAAAVLWLLIALATLVAYVELVFSDPGFIDEPTLRLLVDAESVAVDIYGSANVRGLLDHDTEAVSTSTKDVAIEMAAVNDVSTEGSALCQSSTSAHASAKLAVVVAAADDDDDADDESNVAPAAIVSSSADADEPDAHDDATADAEENEERQAMTGMLGPSERTLNSSNAIAGLPADVARYFEAYSERAGLLVPIRAKFCKKHGRIVARFDHYCYLLGNSVGELNHGRFWILLVLQVTTIWLGRSVVGSVHVHAPPRSLSSAWNAPLLLVEILCYLTGIPLSVLLVIHTYLALCGVTTHEFLRNDHLGYLDGFFEFSCPFSEGPIENLRRFFCPRLRLWQRPLPQSQWPETWWRNRYYACCC